MGSKAFVPVGRGDTGWAPVRPRAGPGLRENSLNTSGNDQKDFEHSLMEQKIWIFVLFVTKTRVVK